MRQRHHLLRHVFLLALALLFLAGYFLVIRPGADRPEGLALTVRVMDRAGRPVPRARVQNVFRAGWHRVLPDGLVTLENVVLRADDPPSPEAFRSAIEVEAPLHGIRRADDVVIARTREGGWDAVFTLEPCGLLVLTLEQTDLPGARASLDSTYPPGSVTSIGGVDVARVDQPASFRVYADTTPLDVRLTGGEGTATRLTRIPPPAPGTTRRVVLEAQPARPIRGRILCPPGPRPPLIGAIGVRQVFPDEPELELRAVVVEPVVEEGVLGVFRVPHVGTGRYRIEPRLRGLVISTANVEGGGEVELEIESVEPWVVLDAGDWPAARTLFDVFRLDDDGEAEAVHHTRSLAGTRRACFVPGPGRYRIRLRAPGASDGPPLEGSAELDVGESGPHRLVVEPRELAWGSIRFGEREHLGTLAASVDLLRPSHRRITLLGDVGGDLRHVKAGKVLVRVRWRNVGSATAFFGGALEAAGTFEINAADERGGTLAIRPATPLPLDASFGVDLVWAAGDTPYGDVAVRDDLLSAWSPSGWVAREHLLPGRYRARITRRGATTGQDVTFVIRAGETTEIAFETE